MYVRILSRHLLPETVDVLSQRSQIRAAFGAHLSLESPSPEREQSRFEFLIDSRKHWSVEIANINDHPEIGALEGHRLGLAAAARAKIVVGNGFVRLEQRLFWLGAGKR